MPSLLHSEMLIQNLWSLLTVIRSGFAAMTAPKALVSFGTRGNAKSNSAEAVKLNSLTRIPLCFVPALA